MKEIEHSLVESKESTKRRYNYISKAPFPTTLYNLTVLKGLTREDLAEVMEMTKGAVSFWFTGRSVPSPKAFGKLLIVLTPDDDELDKLTQAYGCELIKGRGVSRGPS